MTRRKYLNGKQQKKRYAVCGVSTRAIYQYIGPAIGDAVFCSIQDKTVHDLTGFIR